MFIASDPAPLLDVGKRMSYVVAPMILVMCRTFLSQRSDVCQVTLPESCGMLAACGALIRPLRRRHRMNARGTGVTHDAIESIRELIASGEWGPGTRLPREADLAAELGLSRSSLREAVRALSLVRVLEVRQGDGTYISSLEPDLLLGETTRFATHLLQGQTVVELFEVRRLLEPGA